MSPVDRRTLLLAAGAAALAAGCTAPPAQPPSAPTLAPTVDTGTGRRANRPADPKAKPDVHKLLAWLSALPQRESKRVVSGQQVSADARFDYDKLFGGMTRQLGKTPVLIGTTFDGYWKPKNTSVLIDHWRRGGLVTFDLHRPNPFLDKVDPESYRGIVTEPKGDLTKLLADAKPSPARSRWRADLDRIADILQELDEAGVTVIFRPFHEPNGIWFWWGQDHTTGRSDSVKLFRDTYSYMTETRNLHNLLWVYSPARPWNAPRMKYYPGDDVVDIMGPTSYLNTVSFGLEGQSEDISDMLAPERPMALLEVGSGEPFDGTWKSTEIIDRIKARYQQMTMFNCWHGWPGAKVALMEVRETDKLMNDPWVISLENSDWRG
ncbi:glycoside hydrolase family 26 protein [Kibdelosporangium philippinense]|uniref:Glycoside hydrolase family 26 protein n=1 Tax=Kibdelosporangium philippinense TaxID=211113 RepID=A0ABS8ZQ32_9PSEU|nr:glycosyl hydrolase [Kibdelosporangium philippinense]MCE7007902.1 glycoside hydrolase family 26 protein [Kibdelosporangium philippinense]